MTLIPDLITEICPSHSGCGKNVLFRKIYHQETVNFSNKVSSFHTKLSDITGAEPITKNQAMKKQTTGKDPKITRFDVIGDKLK